MQTLAELVASREEWLMARVLHYARERGYTRYTANLGEPWRVSIAGLSASLLSALGQNGVVPEPGPDEDYAQDAIASFGVEEARRHRERGVRLDMFLGLMKYFRRSYLDLVGESELSSGELERAREAVHRFFDRIELGFCVEWTALSEDAKTRELQAANRRITREKNRYLALFETLRDPAALLDGEGRLDRCNEAAALTFECFPDAGRRGGEPATGASQFWAELIPADWGDGGEFSLQRDLETRNGRRRFSIYGRRLVDAGGERSGTLLVFSDITEHEQVQAQLRYRTVLARLVSEVSTDFVGLEPENTDEAIRKALARIGTFMGVDTAYAFLFSEDGERCLLTHLWEKGEPAEASDELQELQVAEMPWWMGRLRSGEVFAFASIDELPPEAETERRVLQWQGVQSLLDVPLTSQGDVIGFMGLATVEQPRTWSDDEITLLRILGQVLTNALRHQQVEQALAQERQLLRTVVDNLPDYIYVKDRESRFVLNNAAHLRLLRGRAADEDVLGKTDFDTFPETLAAAYYADEQAVMSTGQPLVNREETVIDERGHKQWFLTTKVPLRDARGDVVGIVGMSRNISERRRMMEAIEEHARLLEQANEDLRRRNQDLDEFTYVASHDLQEPLRKLSAFSDALTQDLASGDRESVHRDLAAISSGAQRMQQLVQDLLSLSRSGRQKMNLQPVTLDRCVDRALDALELRVRESSAEIVRQRMPVVRGDMSLLTQLYQNLIGNAIKFRGKEPLRIELTAEMQENGWLLGVRDNGIGLKPEYGEQIFAPFRRLHGRDRYEGTGVGLAICRKIVERHGGRIWVESEPGKGAYFRFTLSRTQEDRTT